MDVRRLESVLLCVYLCFIAPRRSEGNTSPWPFSSSPTLQECEKRGKTSVTLCRENNFHALSKQRVHLVPRLTVNAQEAEWRTCLQMRTRPDSYRLCFSSRIAPSLTFDPITFTLKSIFTIRRNYGHFRSFGEYYEHFFSPRLFLWSPRSRRLINVSVITFAIALRRADSAGGVRSFAPIYILCYTDEKSEKYAGIFLTQTQMTITVLHV